MARKTSKSPSKSKKKAKDSPGLFTRLRDAWDTTLGGLAHVMDHAGRIGAATLIGATAILWIVGSDDLQARAASIRAEEPVIDLKLPVWIDESSPTIEPVITETIREFRLFAQGTAGMDPFDREALDAIRSGLAATGWFREGPVVRRLPGNTVQISGVWRAPVAVVEQGTEQYIVGLDAVRMRRPASIPVPAEWLRIENPYMPPPELGKVWTGGDVEDALALLGYLTRAVEQGNGLRREDLDQIAGVDLRRYVETGARSMRLTTRRGATLVWGSVPGPDGPLPGEIGYRTRLERVAMIVTGRARGEDKPGPPLVLNGEALIIDQVPSGGG